MLGRFVPYLVKVKEILPGIVLCNQNSTNVLSCQGAFCLSPRRPLSLFDNRAVPMVALRRRTKDGK